MVYFGEQDVLKCILVDSDGEIGVLGAHIELDGS